MPLERVGGANLCGGFSLSTQSFIGRWCFLPFGVVGPAKLRPAPILCHSMTLLVANCHRD